MNKKKATDFNINYLSRKPNSGLTRVFAASLHMASVISLSTILPAGVAGPNPITQGPYVLAQDPYVAAGVPFAGQHSPQSPAPLPNP